MRSVWLLAAISCLAACGNDPPKTALPTPTPADAGSADAGSATLRVASFNTRRFFDDECNSGNCGGAALAADVVSLQEVENQKAFDALRAELTTGGVDYPIAVLGETGAPASVDVAVLARGTLIETRTHRAAQITRPDGSKTSFTRELLEVRFKTSRADRTVIVFAAHFRSKFDDDPGRRLAEANTTRDLVVAAQKEAPDALVVLAGDLNDTPGSDTLAAIEQGGLVRVAKELPVASQTTFVFNGSPLTIDHIYATTESAPRFRAGTAAVVKDGTVGLAGSDHAAVRADFAIE
jgi:uncharacterized protein